MATEPLALALPRKSIAATTLATWLVSAAGDFVCASLLGILAYGSTFNRFWQGVASVPFGPRVFEMGARGVAAGLALHPFVAFVWAAGFLLARTRSAAS